MLDRHKLMTEFPGPLESLIQAKFKLARKHSYRLLSGFFHRTQQRMLVLFRNTHDLRNLRLRYFEAEDAADPFSLGMYL
jgi:hypothetical protein